MCLHVHAYACVCVYKIMFFLFFVEFFQSEIRQKQKKQKKTAAEEEEAVAPKVHAGRWMSTERLRKASGTRGCASAGGLRRICKEKKKKKRSLWKDKSLGTI